MSGVPSDHVPVLSEAVVGFLGQPRTEVFVDCTVGLGGHAGLLLDASPRLRLLGLDVDDANLAVASERLARFGDRVRLVRASFEDLGEVLAEQGEDRVGAVLADLGVSSNQLADSDRGLSFEVDGPLDMRLDRRTGTTAADLVNTLSEGDLADLLYFQSQERGSRRIARRICQARRQGRLNSTVMLARLVVSALGAASATRRSRIHPATRTFMALRMSVNRERESLQRLLAQVPSCLCAGGRVAILAFHSVEDRIVKEDFRTRGRCGEYRVLTKKPVVASERERAENPRSRSAKLRVAELAAPACAGP
jgi:16S rRNA (cytosine1402-N4)-methyltransferase